jgi:hypothetical protein
MIQPIIYTSPRRGIIMNTVNSIVLNMESPLGLLVPVVYDASTMDARALEGILCKYEVVKDIAFRASYNISGSVGSHVVYARTSVEAYESLGIDRSSGDWGRIERI